MLQVNKVKVERNIACHMLLVADEVSCSLNNLLIYMAIRMSQNHYTRKSRSANTLEHKDWPSLRDGAPGHINLNPVSVSYRASGSCPAWTL